MPICNRCDLDKPISEFHSRKDRRGYQYTCKSCKSLYARKGEARQKSVPSIFLHSMDGEDWLPIPGYPGYEASNKGRIRSNKQGKTKLLKGSTSHYGYRQVGLYDKASKLKTILIHTLIAQLFIGHCPPNKQVNHIDFDRQNNTVENLEYVTQKENIAHNVKHQRHVHGESVHTSQLKEFEVLQIFRDPRPASQVAQEYAISPEMVRNIRNGKSWKHITR